MGEVLKDPASAALRQQIVRFFTAYPVYRGLSLDFESLPDDATPGLHGLHPGAVRRSAMRAICASMSTPRWPPATRSEGIAANSDGIILMNYDEHQTTSDPGPIASQDWFVGNLHARAEGVPKEKLICAIGSYGYDWTLTIPNPKNRKQDQSPRC
jgi:hypothetical protein